MWLANSGASNTNRVINIDKDYVLIQQLRKPNYDWLGTLSVYEITVHNHIWKY